MIDWRHTVLDLADIGRHLQRIEDILTSVRATERYPDGDMIQLLIDARQASRKMAEKFDSLVHMVERKKV